MKHALLTMDNRDDRVEFRSLLRKLTPRRRLAFLEWCCRECDGPTPKMREWVNGRWCPSEFARRVEAATRSDRDDDVLVYEITMDFWVLTCQWGLDGERAARVLERYVKTGELPPSPAVPLSCTSRPV